VVMTVAVVVAVSARGGGERGGKDRGKRPLCLSSIDNECVAAAVEKLQSFHFVISCGRYVPISGWKLSVLK